jgi:hypothetical protein
MADPVRTVISVAGQYSAAAIPSTHICLGDAAVGRVWRLAQAGIALGSAGSVVAGLAGQASTQARFWRARPRVSRRRRLSAATRTDSHTWLRSMPW